MTNCQHCVLSIIVILIAGVISLSNSLTRVPCPNQTDREPYLYACIKRPQIKRSAPEPRVEFRVPRSAPLDPLPDQDPERCIELIRRGEGYKCVPRLRNGRSVPETPREFLAAAPEELRVARSAPLEPLPQENRVRCDEYVSPDDAWKCVPTLLSGRYAREVALGVRHRRGIEAMPREQDDIPPRLRYGRAALVPPSMARQ